MYSSDLLPPQNSSSGPLVLRQYVQVPRNLVAGTVFFFFFLHQVAFITRKSEKCRINYKIDFQRLLPSHSHPHPSSIDLTFLSCLLMKIWSGYFGKKFHCFLVLLFSLCDAPTVTKVRDFLELSKASNGRFYAAMLCSSRYPYKKLRNFDLRILLVISCQISVILT